MKHALHRLMGVTAAFAAITLSLPVYAEKRRRGKGAGGKKLIHNAAQTLKNFVADLKMTWFRDNVQNTKAVASVPTFVKGGFVLGGSGSNCRKYS